MIKIYLEQIESQIEVIEFMKEGDVSDYERGLLSAYKTALVFFEKINDKIKELEDRELFLNCLEAAGVDNWTGYSFAWDEYEGFKKENENE